MAADYEVRAKVARELVEPPLGDEIKVLAEPGIGEPLMVKPVRKITVGLKEPVIAQRRPAVRPWGGYDGGIVLMMVPGPPERGGGWWTGRDVFPRQWVRLPMWDSNSALTGNRAKCP
jgi:hypothetical protein